MTKSDQETRARSLLDLHTSGRLLVLPNIWTPIGAKILQSQGYPAVATASAAVSAVLGFADGERISRATLIDVLARICRAVDVPVTADIEAGYGASLSDLADALDAVIDTGVVGINIEDGLQGGGLRPLDDQCERIAKVREVAASRGLHLVINARVDAFVSGDFPSLEERIEEAVVRARAYVEAGADCVYPMGPR